MAETTTEVARRWMRSSAIAAVEDEIAANYGPTPELASIRTALRNAVVRIECIPIADEPPKTILLTEREQAIVMMVRGMSQTDIDAVTKFALFLKADR